MPKQFIFNTLLELVYPPLCPLCNLNWRTINDLENLDSEFCDSCNNKLINICENFCPKCGLPVGKEANANDCKSCRGRSIHYDRLLFVNDYKTYLGELVLNFKYGKDKLLVYFLADWLYKRVKHDYQDVDLITAVPMHWSKKIKRGYNQAEILAYELSKKMNKPFDGSILDRFKSENSQAGQSRTVRYKSVKGLYFLKQNFEAKKILLVDDVVTTGSTMSECAKVLKSSGCEIVYCASITGVHRDK